MATELIINASLPETRIALTEDGEIQELLIERSSEKGIAGNIYKGRVTRVLPGMQAAFVDIGLEKAAFLYVDDVYTAPLHSPEDEGDDDREGSSEGEVSTAPVGAETDSEAASIAGEDSSDASSANEEMADAYDADLDEADRAEAGMQTDGDSGDDEDDGGEDEDDSEPEGSEDGDPVSMGPGPDEDSSGGEGSDSSAPEGTVAPESGGSSESSQAGDAPVPGETPQQAGERKRRRGRRGGRGRRNRGGDGGQGRGDRPQGQGRVVVQTTLTAPENDDPNIERLPGKYQDQVQDAGDLESDRSSLGSDGAGNREGGSREETSLAARVERRGIPKQKSKDAFRQQRGRDRRVGPKAASAGRGHQVNIQDLLREGQEVLVQVSKDPIATKGARLTCHISLPGRHLVCMPTIDHVGVSRRIERDDERRKLREFVERNRPKKLGFIVRTASGRNQAEKRIKQDIDYLSTIWEEIRTKAETSSAPSMVYEDLNPVLRSIRDWVNEDIDKVIVDSRYHFNDITRFVSHFMPAIRSKIELYHGDIPIFDAYGISSELSRALERKVWLKSGGYIVIDQAEALVAIDVNTGRFVGKKNLEDTILKTNLEAVQEIAYQLRLRNCGGIIILDLIDMEKEENKRRVYMALEEALKKDRSRPTILKISELGLVEMTRKRTRDTMVRTLCESCTHCEGKGFIKGRATVAYEVLRQVEREGINREAEKILVQAHPDVVDFLAIEERESVDQLERRYRKQIYLQAVMDYHPEQFDVGVDKEVSAERLIASTTEREHRGDRDRNRGRGRDRNDRERGGRDRGGRDRDRDRDRNSNSSRGPTPNGEASVSAPAEAGSSAQGAADGMAPGIVAGGASGEPRRPVIIPAVRPVVSIQSTPMAQASGDAESLGNYSAESASPGNGSALGSMSAPAPGSDMDDEDRLAFLRAQAAQDAALARLGAGGAAAQSLSGGHRGGGGGGRGFGGGGGAGGGGRGGKRRGGRGGRGGGGGGGRFRPDGGNGGNY